MKSQPKHIWPRMHAAGGGGPSHREIPSTRESLAALRETEYASFQAIQLLLVGQGMAGLNITIGSPPARQGPVPEPKEARGIGGFSMSVIALLALSAPIAYWVLSA